MYRKTLKNYLGLFLKRRCQNMEMSEKNVLLLWEWPDLRFSYGESVFLWIPTSCNFSEFVSQVSSFLPPHCRENKLEESPLSLSLWDEKRAAIWWPAQFYQVGLGTFWEHLEYYFFQEASFTTGFIWLNVGANVHFSKSLSVLFTVREDLVILTVEFRVWFISS